eukprot:TRINITY_DN1539_c1_g1_i1.p1 TRINITY_DN1539_c1_g1~~TRINITY_DN1539_c1_g1_i1.p1  ORF type:complete len:729 (+),score=140.53 TRINITY_DN1539_c1_g1_i1:56-2188(+)
MGKGRGCCGGSDEVGVQTFAGDDRDPASIGLPDSVKLENPSRRVINSDTPMCLVFAVFWIGMFVIADVAFDKGDPLRLLYGTDYLGNRCGKGSAPSGWNDAVIKNKASGDFPYQNESWNDNTLLWLPVPYSSENLTDSSMTNFDAERALAAGVCVSACPQFGFNSRTAQDVLNDPSLYASLNKVFTYGSSNTSSLPDTFNVWYDSHSVYRRCIPSSSSLAISSSLKSAYDNIPGVTRVTNWFQRGLSDLEEAYIVLIYCGIIALCLPFIYVLLLRLILKPLIWTILILILLGLGFASYFCYTKYDSLDNDSNEDNDNDAKLWLAFCIIFGICAALFLCFLVWFCKKINAACEIIQQAGKVLTSDPSLLLVPVITGLSTLALLVWIVYVSLYVWTIREDGEVIVDGNAAADEVGYNLTLTLPKDFTTTRNMLYYNLFGWLWTMGLLSSIGYFVIAAATVQWYYSHVNDDEKKIPCVMAWGKGYFWAFAYHLGCLITGSLLVAILQFIRFIVQKATQKLKNSCTAVACIMCLVDCCLAYIERILQYISRNAYIMTAIEGSGFWCSCCKVISVLLGSIEYLAPLLLVSDIVFFIGKLFLVAANVFIGYLFLENDDMAPNVDNGVFVLIVIGLFSYGLASLFMSVYESAIDSMFVLIFHENGQPKDPALFFCPGDVFETVTGKKKSDASMFKSDFQSKQSPKEGAVSAEPVIGA